MRNHSYDLHLQNTKTCFETGTRIHSSMSCSQEPLINSSFIPASIVGVTSKDSVCIRSGQFFSLVFGQGPRKNLICETHQVFRNDCFLFCITKTIPSGGVGSCCPSRRARQGHLARLLVMILPQTLPLAFQGLGVYLRYPPYGSGQTVTKCRPKTQKAVIDSYLHSCSSLATSASTKREN